MASPQKIMVVDDNLDSRFLLTKTVMRKFPRAILVECGDAGSAIATAASENIAAIIVHRTVDVTGVELLAQLRRICPTVPIVLMSGYDRSVEALAVGATCFLNYDEWLRIGTVLGDLLSPPTGAPPPAISMSPFPPAPRKTGAAHD